MNALKEVFFRLAAKPPLPHDRASILMYHSVSAGADYFMNVEPKDFEMQMAYLVESKIPVISFRELVQRLQSHQPLGGAIVLTFDDGYRDNFTVAFPVLKKYGFHATIFVTTDMIGKVDKRNLPRLSIDEMKEMESTGLIDIEPHTKTHPKLATLFATAAEQEIQGSKQTIEQILGKTATVFAYPYGNFNDETERLVRNAGFLAAVSVGEGTVHAHSDSFRLPRNSIDASTTFAQFKGKVSTTIDLYNKCKRLL